MKIIPGHILFLLAISCSIKMASQNETDALRYSMHETPMTARSYGMGGAFGALGADLSSYFHNPAGIAMYKRGGVEISFGLNNNTAHSTYMGSGADNSKTNFNLNNFGIVSSQKTNEKKVPSINFGFAYAKTNNFNENITIHGKSESSLLTPFSFQANGVMPSEINDFLPFTGSLAYNSGAIIAVDTLNHYYEPASAGEVEQTKNIERTGSQGESAFGLGVNVKDFLMFGLSINFQSVRFREKSNYSESFGSDQPVSGFNYIENLRSDGTGANIKLGAIVKPTKWLRAGLAFHSPSRIVLRETYSVTMYTNKSEDQISPDLFTDYSVRTPSHLLANVAFVLGKTGVVSADYEFTNYDRIKMRGASTNSYDYASENKTIGTIYRSTHKVRMGMEMRFLQSYYLRGGAIYQQNPLVNDAGAANNPLITYTGGIGYRSDHFFADLGAGYSQKVSSYYLYDPTLVQATNISSSNLNFLLSVGFKY